jgi:hypothetical protein
MSRDIASAIRKEFTPENPLPVTSSGAGNSSATSANQNTQIVLETAIRNQIGSTPIDGVSMPSGGVGLFGWLSAIWKLIGDRLPILTLVSDALKITGTVQIGNSSIEIANDAGNPIPINGTVTANIGTTGDLATDATLQQVRDAIKAQINFAVSLFTDNSGAYYVRRESINEGTGVITVTFTDVSGNVITPGVGLRPLATADKDTITDFYDVLVSGTGYSVGDLLSRIAILDINSGTPSASFIWLNLTAGTILSSAPTGANIERANENVGSRQVGNWTVAISNLNSDPPTGTQQGVANTKLTSLDNKTPAIGANTTANSRAITIASDDAIATAIRDRLMPPGTTNYYLGNSAGANIKNSPGVIYAITCSNFSSATQYFQVFNKASSPLTNEVPLISFLIPPNNGFLIIGQEILGGTGIPLSTGLSWGFSASRLIYSAGTAADCIATVRWA